MYRLFTVDEAKELIPIIESHLLEMQGALRDVISLRKGAHTLKPNSVETRNLAEETGFLLRSIQETKAELDRLGVFVKDVDTGTVDFPSQLGSEVVLLCWQLGEPTITHYHRLSEGEGNRQILPPPGAELEHVFPS